MFEPVLTTTLTSRHHTYSAETWTLLTSQRLHSCDSEHAESKYYHTSATTVDTCGDDVLSHSFALVTAGTSITVEI